MEISGSTLFERESFSNAPEKGISALSEINAPDVALTSFLVGKNKNRIELREIKSDPEINPDIAELKIALAQIHTEPGALDYNAEKHIGCMREAFERGEYLIVFPELSLPNYCSHDLFLDPVYVRAQEAWLKYIAEASKQFPGLTAAIGCVDTDWSKARPDGRPWNYNALAIISNGEIKQMVNKTLLPTYSIFDEARWFVPAETNTIVEINGHKVGFVICEDIWTKGYDRDPVAELIAQGADIIVHVAASPIHVGKNDTRAALAREITDRYKVPFVSVNMVGCFDGYEGDVPFDGRGLARSASGQWLAMGKPFKEELLLIDPFHAAPHEITDLTMVEELYHSALSSIRDYFNRLERITGIKKNAVLGESGGIDSGLMTALLVDALGAERVRAYSLPTKFNKDETKNDAELVARNLGVKFKEIPIQGWYEAGLECLKDAIDKDRSPDKRARQNLQARLRTAAIMTYAIVDNGIMINTGNKTERFTNNFTIYADSAGGIAPLADMDKDRVYALARFVNRIHGVDVIPQSMIDREASAELDHDQVDANVMGDKPEIVAPYIRTIIESRINDPETAKKHFAGKIDPKLIDRWFGQIAASEWKGRQITPGTRVTPVAHGFGRRIPINHGWSGQLPE